MAKNYNTSCDNCGKIVYGQDRGAFVRKDNIFINGQMGRNFFDEETKYKETIYYTRQADQMTAFCDRNCLVEWMEREEELFFNRKQARLREEAENNITGQDRFTPHANRPAWSSEHQPAAKPKGSAPAPAAAPKHFGYGKS